MSLRVIPDNIITFQDENQSDKLTAYIKLVNDHETKTLAVKFTTNIRKKNAIIVKPCAALLSPKSELTITMKLKASKIPIEPSPRVKILYCSFGASFFIPENFNQFWSQAVCFRQVNDHVMEINRALKGLEPANKAVKFDDNNCWGDAPQTLTSNNAWPATTAANNDEWGTSAPDNAQPLNQGWGGGGWQDNANDNQKQQDAQQPSTEQGWGNENNAQIDWNAGTTSQPQNDNGAWNTDAQQGDTNWNTDAQQGDNNNWNNNDNQWGNNDAQQGDTNWNNNDNNQWNNNDQGDNNWNAQTPETNDNNQNDAWNTGTSTNQVGNPETHHCQHCPSVNPLLESLIILLGILIFGIIIGKGGI